MAHVRGRLVAELLTPAGLSAWGRPRGTLLPQARGGSAERYGHFYVGLAEERYRRLLGGGESRSKAPCRVGAAFLQLDKDHVRVCVADDQW
jgi:hypothetical protein